jgi:hypothetical protein
MAHLGMEPQVAAREPIRLPHLQSSPGGYSAVHGFLAECKMARY